MTVCAPALDRPLPSGVAAHVGEDYLHRLDRFSLLVRSPGDDIVVFAAGNKVAAKIAVAGPGRRIPVGEPTGVQVNATGIAVEGIVCALGPLPAPARTDGRGRDGVLYVNDSLSAHGGGLFGILG